MNWELIEDFLEWTKGKENKKGEVLLTSSEILNFLQKFGRENLTFKRFNKLLCSAYLGRSTGNKYRYSIRLLKRSFETKSILMKSDREKEKFSFHSRGLNPPSLDGIRF